MILFVNSDGTHCHCFYPWLVCIHNHDIKTPHGQDTAILVTQVGRTAWNFFSGIMLHSKEIFYLKMKNPLILCRTLVVTSDADSGYKWKKYTEWTRCGDDCCLKLISYTVTHEQIVVEKALLWTEPELDEKPGERNLWIGAEMLVWWHRRYFVFLYDARDKSKGWIKKMYLKAHWW